jgi:hypothetical protein
MSSCDPCTGVGPNGSAAGGGGAPPAVVTLQAAIDGQGALATEQSIVTSVDLNAGTGAWQFRDAANAPMFSVTDVVGVQVGQSFAYTGDISPGALAAGATANYAPAGVGTCAIMRLTPNAAGSTISGITTGADGRQIIIHNLSTAATITLLHDDGASSTAANRFLCPNAQSVVLPPLGSATIVYDATSSRWRVIGTQASSSEFLLTPQSAVGATTVVWPIATVGVAGAHAVVEGLWVKSIFTAGVPAGDIGQMNYAGTFTGQNSTTDGVVSMWGPIPWGPPAGGDVPNNILEPNSVGYQPPLLYGTPGGIACGIRATGTQLELFLTGIGGFTTLVNGGGRVFVYAGAIRLLP